MKNSMRFTWINVIVVTTLFGVFIGIDLVLALSHSTLIEVYDSVPDEILFYHQAKILSTLLVSGDWHAISSFGTPYGYGFPFWLTAAGIILALPDAMTHGVAAHKLIFLAMKWFSFGAFLPPIWRRRGPTAVSFFAVMIVACSAFFFYGKIFSPEFEMLALAAASIIFLWKDQGRLAIQTVFSLCMAFIATAIKLTAFPVLLAAGGYSILTYVRQRQVSFAAIPAYLITVVTFLLCLLPFFTVAGRLNAISWASLNVGRHYSGENFVTWFLYRNTTWDVIPLGGAISFLGAMGALAFFTLNWISTDRKNINDSELPRIIVVSALIGFVFIVLGEGYFDWYLWIPALMLIAATAMSMPTTPLKPWPLVACTFLILASLPETLRRISMRHEVLSELSDAKYERSSIRELLSRAMPRCGKPLVVATDFLLALENEDPNIRVYRLRDWATEAIPDSSPFFKFRNQFWLPQSFFSAELNSFPLPTKSQVTHILTNERLKHIGLSPFGNIAGAEIASNREAIHFGGITFRLVENIGNSALYETTSSLCTTP